MTLAAELEAIAEETEFSGVVTTSVDGGRVVELTRGFADRANRRAVEPTTAFATASATKGLTALTAASLVESGQLSFDTTLRSLIGNLLPLVDDAVTIEQLMSHTSGVGDYLDEDELGDIDDEVLAVPANRLVDTGDYVQLMADVPKAAEPGSRFKYNNGGYVMLSIAIEAVAGVGFHEAVRERVLEPAGMSSTAFYRSDELPAGAAIGYLANGRSNIFHLPVRGAGDGGCYTTALDIDKLWQALFAGNIVSTATVSKLTTPKNFAESEDLNYGMGFWLGRNSATVILEGMDAGVSFRAAIDPPSMTGYTVVSNTSDGAWPLAAHLDEQLAAIVDGRTRN